MKLRAAFGIIILLAAGYRLSVVNPPAQTSEISKLTQVVQAEVAVAQPEVKDSPEKESILKPLDPLIGIQNRIVVLQKLMDEDRVMRPLRENKLSESEVKQVAIWAGELTELQAQEIQLRLRRLKASLSEGSL